MLVLDSHPDSAEILGELVLFLGHEVRVALSHSEASNAVKNFVPHIALIDLDVRRGAPRQLVEELRDQSPMLRQTHFVAIGAIRASEITRQMIDAGFSFYLVKPISLEVLRDMFSGYEKATEVVRQHE